MKDPHQEDTSPEAAEGNSPEATAQDENGGREQPPGRLIVAGIGASAGGIEALQAFFEALPEKLGVAFVVIIHLSPEHQSHLAEILAAHTSMPVEQVQVSVPLAGDHIYVIPPDRRLQITDTDVGAFPFAEPRGQRTPIDTFFHSLAEQYGDGFGVILSGGGSDGAAGVKAIKEQGGLILVQDPKEAVYPSMPRAAIATGVADIVLPVRELAAQLAELARTKRRISPVRGVEQPARLTDSDEAILSQILAHLHARTGHDFAKYKRSTVLRRLSRRMQVHRKETLEDYLAFLRQNVEEAQALFDDLLISVTSFFRDPEAFEALREKVISKLFEAETEDGCIRVWVPGCATGEEAYSLAILLLEEAVRRNVWPDLQVFASDLDEGSLATGREGRYPAAIEADVSTERLRRFFVREGDHYRITKEVRNCVLFATHSLLKDPPFSRIDLISCRNLLIYLDHGLQAQLFGLLRYALRPGGYLFLGASETAEGPYFRTLDKTHHLYQARQATGQEPPPFPDLLFSMPRRHTPAEHEWPWREPPPLPALHRKLLEELAPPSILVDENRTALHLSETAGRFLQPPGGPLAHDLTELVRPELQVELRTALYRAFERDEAGLSPFVPVQFNGTPRRVAILVQPRRGENNERLALVVFLEGGEAALAGALPTQGEAQAESVRQLQEELSQTQARMGVMREEHEAANEELRAANEELQSINEEYRSTAEELETSKEELQSINEELETVNNELKHKFEEVSLAHSDLENLIAATEIGTLFLDPNLRIHRFTPHLADIFNVTPADRGRPITDFSHRLNYDQLERDARQVIDELVPIERELQSVENRWYLARFRPYRTLDHKIDGVVVTFVDITERKRSEEAVQAAREYAESIVDTVREPLVILTPTLHVRSANASFYKTFQVSPEETEGRLLYDLGNGQWNTPTLRGLLEDVLPENAVFEGFEVTHDFEAIGRRTMLLYARLLHSVQLILLAIEDVTERKQAEEALKDLNETLEKRVEERTEQMREREAWFRALVDASAQIVWTTDTAGVVVADSPSWRAFTGQSYDEIRGWGWTNAVHPEDREFTAETWRRSVETETPVDTEYRAYHAGSGEYRWTRVRAVPLRSPDGVVRGWVGMNLDIHERKQAEVQLREMASRLTIAEQEERRRISQILHDDLQQLLYGIQLKLLFIRQDAETGERAGLQAHAEEASAWLDNAITTARRLAVDLSPPVLQGEDFTDALDWLAAQMEEIYGLHVEVEAEPAISDGDIRVLLFQIIRELLFNVVKHAGTDRATVTLREEDGRLVIYVSDEGRGFEVEETLKTRGHNGFGLFSARERLSLFGGRMEIASRPGEGTRVTIYAPTKSKVTGS